MKAWSRRTWTKLYQWVVILSGTAVLGLARPDWTREPEVLVTLVVLFALAEYFPTRVRVGAVSFSFPMAYAAFLLYGTSGAVLVAAVGTIAANAARRRAWHVAWFNAAQFAVAALVAGWLSLKWPGSPTLAYYVQQLIVYAGLYFLVNNLIVDGILLVRLRRYRLTDWLSKNRFESLSAVISVAYCALMLFIAPQRRGHDPLALSFFFLPLLTVGVVTRLLTNLSRFASHMRALLQVSTLVTFAQDGSQALEAALAHVDAVDDYRFAAIYQVEGDELALCALRGIPPERLGHQRIAVGEGLTGWAARQAAPVFAPDARHDARNRIGEGIQAEAEMLAAIPLISSGRVIGVLTLGKERAQPAQPEDMRLLTILANLLSAILRNMHLAEEREKLLLVQERNRLAREIHDGLAQSLAGAILQLDRLERLQEADTRGAQRLLQSVREYLRETLLDVRRSIFNLRPSPVDEQGLPEALRREIQRLKEKGLTADADLRFDVRGEQRRLSPLVEDEAFRIAQEGLTNALKHAGATEITVGLHFFPDRLRLTVRDNGQGFRLADAIRGAQGRGSFGLTGMSERAERLSASFDVDSRPETGTRITVEIPLLGE